MTLLLGPDGKPVYRTVLYDAAGTPVSTGVQFAEDGALGSTPQGTAIMVRRDDVLSTLGPAEGDAVVPRVNVRGALWVAEDFLDLDSKGARYTTAQTGTALWTPAGGKRLIITSFHIDVGGTTAGDVQLWFGASGDTTFTRGTDRAIFDGGFIPSATLRPGAVQTGEWPASAADHILRVTSSAAVNPLTVTVWGREV